MVRVGDAWHIFKELSGGFRSQIFDVFEATGVTFYSILGSFWDALAPFGHPSGPLGAGVTENSNFLREMSATWKPFWVPFQCHWLPLVEEGPALEPNWHPKWLKVEICGVCGNECFPYVKRVMLIIL